MKIVFHKFMESCDHSKSADVIARGHFKPKDLAIGAGLITAGVGYLVNKAFKMGCVEAVKGYDKTLVDIGCLDEEAIDGLDYESYLKKKED